MLKNAGKSIKAVVKIVYILNIVLACLIAIVGILYGIKEETPAICIAGVLAGALWVFISWLSSLVLYAYGEMSQSTVEMNATLKEIKRMMPPSSGAPEGKPARAPKAPEVPAAPAAPAAPQWDFSAPVYTPPTPSAPVAPAAPAAQPAKWSCPNCGKLMDNRDSFCNICGTPKP